MHDLRLGDTVATPDGQQGTVVSIGVDAIELVRLSDGTFSDGGTRTTVLVPRKGLKRVPPHQVERPNVASLEAPEESARPLLHGRVGTYVGCPHCFKTVRAGNATCRHCGTIFGAASDNGGAAPPATHTARSGLFRVARWALVPLSGVIGLLIVSVVVIAIVVPSKPSDPAQTAAPGGATSPTQKTPPAKPADWNMMTADAQAAWCRANTPELCSQPTTPTTGEHRASTPVMRGGIDLKEACTNSVYFRDRAAETGSPRDQEQFRAANALLAQFPDQDEVSRVCAAVAASR